MKGVKGKRTCKKCEGKGYILSLDGSWIRTKREEAGISLRSLAKGLGISPAYLSDLELGRRNGSESKKEQLISTIQKLTKK